eukprot:TRINITY_DN3100_c0_g1_i1.p1 TRINITY_DN3100_c0_g1~~TRINITY_DN3100_c0_g1_i1.p1  ORF type:complete len:163 (+),score=6.61 TRINITY_DN3100_c0_g1_i1:105-593(+)
MFCRLCKQLLCRKCQYPFFYQINRQKAIALLIDQRVGTYLLRPSSILPNLVFSYVKSPPGLIEHISINVEIGQNVLFVYDTSIKRNSIQELIKALNHILVFPKTEQNASAPIVQNSPLPPYQDVGIGQFTLPPLAIDTAPNKFNTPVPVSYTHLTLPTTPYV